MPYLPITEHGLIGDLHTAALVGTDGRIVWLPWPRFDSPSIFASLLDDQQGGEWLLAPRDISSSSQAYADDTAVLITTFQTPTGRAEAIDWMSPWDGDAPGHDVCRVLLCVEGEVQLSGRFAARPDYARGEASLRAVRDGIDADTGDGVLELRSSVPWQIDGSDAVLETTLRAGETIRCLLRAGNSPVTLATIEQDLVNTRQFWSGWIGSCDYRGRYEPLVRRAAITLKLLTYAPSGAIVAAPTTSLPEWIGGGRNWDYRFTWLRDATLTLDALCGIGFHEEEGRFFNWLNRLAQQQATPLQIMYGVDGTARLDEQELRHLEGYRGSKPVRVGNAAYKQRQLDSYGSVLNAANSYIRHQHRLSEQQWSALRDEVDYVCSNWREPDQGIWEMRGPPRQHTYSKIMCWVTLDRALKLAEHDGWEHDREGWTSTRDMIHADILEHAWNEQLGAFTQTYGSSDLDASLLLIPQLEFLPPSDPRVRETISRIESKLSKGALVYRYTNDDDLPGEEGAFLLCSFWMVEALAAVGELDAARERFEQLLGYCSAHGLLSEEIDPAGGTALGNYPQAFSHIGLINSALALQRAEQSDRVNHQDTKATKN